MERRNTGGAAGRIALGGTTAALAVVIMSLGGVIPFATYCAPILACLLLLPVLALGGRRIAWAWFAAVAVLSAFLCPDKEAAGVFVFLGYYPILKPRMDRLPTLLRWLCKGLLFNCAAALLYAVLIFLMGMDALAEEFREAGAFMLVLMLLMGNATFLILDKLIGRLTILLKNYLKKEP